MNSRKSVVIAVSIIFTTFYFLEANAETLRWSLNDVLFEDGGSASGWFDFDSTAGPCDPTCPGLSDWSISVSGGDEITFPPFTYDSDTSLGEAFPPDEPGFPGHILSFKDLSTFPERLVALYAASPLTDPGVMIDIIRIEQNVGSVECFNCNPFRKKHQWVSFCNTYPFTCM